MKQEKLINVFKKCLVQEQKIDMNIDKLHLQMLSLILKKYST